MSIDPWVSVLISSSLKREKSLVPNQNVYMCNDVTPNMAMTLEWPHSHTYYGVVSFGSASHQ